MGKQGGIQKHCIILHGFSFEQNWFGHPVMMNSIVGALEPTLRQCGWKTWVPEYPTTMPFKVGARLLMDNFQLEADRHGYDFTNTVFIGYSMGGVVARQMIAYGFPCNSLITIASPHFGLLPYINVAQCLDPTGIARNHPGVWSLWNGSQDLAALNRNMRDEVFRRVYNLFGLTFTGHFGENHDDDGCVHIESATAPRLSPAASINIHVDNSTFKLGNMPHANQALDPMHVRQFMDCCRYVLEHA